jgi:hypothetical protein
MAHRAERGRRFPSADVTSPLTWGKQVDGGRSGLRVGFLMEWQKAAPDPGGKDRYRDHLPPSPLLLHSSVCPLPEFDALARPAVGLA